MTYQIEEKLVNLNQVNSKPKERKPLDRRVFKNELILGKLLKNAGFNISINRITREVYFEDKDGFGLSGTAVYVKDGKYFEFDCPDYSEFRIDTTSKAHVELALYRNLTEPLMVAKLGFTQGLTMALIESVDFDILAKEHVLENKEYGVDIYVNNDSLTISNGKTSVSMKISKYDFRELVRVYKWAHANLETVFSK